MDLRRLSRAMPSGKLNGNSTEPLSLTELPPNILDALVPGYSLVSRYMQAAFGVDVSVFVSVAVVFFAIMKGGQYLKRQIERYLRYSFVCSVYIDEHDDLFDMVMAWLAKNQGTTSRRSVRAKTQRGLKAQAEMDENYDAQVDDVLDEKGMFDYNKWSARTPPRFEPYYGRHFLRHDGSWFLIRRSEKSSNNQRVQVRFGGSTEDDLLQIDCFGRSIAPIEDLLRTVKVWSLMRMRHTTTIRHQTPKDRARFGGMWSKISSRPSRPMETVILDHEEKSMIIKDMNEYLHPASPKWYATRGIPYRRGYLFHGPPGTGKTSLSFALAGIFGLEIYVISLQEPSMTEGDLMQLFNGLPRRCVVLLEDVDAAGLIRDGKSDKPDDGAPKKGKGGKGGKGKKGNKDKDEKDKDGKDKDDESNTDDKTKSEKTPEKDEDYTLKDLARELKSIGAPKRGGGGGDGNNNNQGHPNRQPGTGISLSGLLNAIDGVASHEGRVLIMTTNHPEKLDSALVRPGRIDRKVEFRLAMKEQIRELFVRMYTPTEEPTSQPSKSMNGTQLNGNHAVDEKKGLLDPKAKDEIAENSTSAIASQVEIEELAAEFAAGLADDTFTPAEIQNHLMKYKDSPRVAVETSSEWARNVLEEKEKQSKEKEEEESDEEDSDDDD